MVNQAAALYNKPLPRDAKHRKQRGEVRLDLLELVGDALGPFATFAGWRGRATNDHGSANPGERVEQALDACVGCVGSALLRFMRAKLACAVIYREGKQKIPLGELALFREGSDLL